MRASRSMLGAFVAAMALVGGLGAPDARCDDDEYDELASPGLVLSDIAPRLPGIAKRLKARGDVTEQGSFTVLSDREYSAREAAAERLTAAWGKAAAALASVGFSVPENPPAFTVILVRVKSGPTQWVRALGEPVLLLREGATARLTEPAAVAARPDGAAIRRDALVAAHATRAWQMNARAAAATRSGESYFIARQAVAAAMARDTVPAWAYEGFVAWTEQRIAPNDVPAHFCRSFTAPTPALLARALAVKDATSSVAARFLGRFVGALSQGRTDVPKLLADLGPSPDAAAVGAAFGTSADAALAAACGGLKDAAGTCDDAGRLACPACKGAGKVELACADCRGAGALVCPSCRGDNNCPSDCDRGTVVYEGGRKAKCRVCSGGQLKCQACSGTLRSSCRTCSGSGKGSWPCLGCAGSGRIACPEAGTAPETSEGSACLWCQDPSRVVACPDCAGVGYLGCDACWGTVRRACPECYATGEVRMVYSDGTTASQSKCKPCEGRGFTRCDECKGGRAECVRCAGKGRGKASGLFVGTTNACDACEDGKTPSVESLAARFGAQSDVVSEAEAAANQAMLTRAVQFLLTCNRTSTGAFALRKFRATGAEEAGALEEPTLFANADVLWTLSVVGIDTKDARTARAWQALRTDAGKIVLGTAEYAGTQAVAQTIRAFSAGGEDMKSPLMEGLVAKLVKGQHASGWWGDSLDGKDADDPLDSLMAVEALRVARLRGAKVPRSVWHKILRVASAEFDSKGPAGMKSGFMGASEVLSNMALVVMAKEGSLGSKASAFDYASLPAIRKGLAWLDRYFDIRQEPTFVKGALFKRTSDAGYSAYIFAVQRLAMLLNIAVLGGERWHTTGARHLTSIQHKDGSFEEKSVAHLNGPVRTTTSCVLFLARATTPITDVDDGE